LGNQAGRCPVGHLGEVNTIPGNNRGSACHRAADQTALAALRRELTEPEHAGSHAQTQQAKE